MNLEFRFETLILQDLIIQVLLEYHIAFKCIFQLEGKLSDVRLCNSVIPSQNITEYYLLLLLLLANRQRLWLDRL